MLTMLHAAVGVAIAFAVFAFETITETSAAPVATWPGGVPRRARSSAAPRPPRPCAEPSRCTASRFEAGFGVADRTGQVAGYIPLRKAGS